MSVPATDYTDLLSALQPHAKAYAGCPIVIKYGGNAMTDEALKAGFAQDWASAAATGISFAPENCS